LSFVYERPDADIIDGEWRDEAEGQTLYDNLDETATESSLLQPAVLLCHFDGADGSTTFTDSSASAHTLTVTGSGGTQIDTAKSKFGGASGLFPGGSGDYLSMTTSSDFSFPDDFTIDCWMYFNSVVGFASPFDTSGNGSGAGTTLLFYVSGSVLAVLSNSVGVVQSPNGLVAGRWYHMAVTRAGTTIRLFLDGNLEDSDTFVTSLTNSNPIIGRLHDGWIDELRVVKGEALWTTNFQPPTSPSTPATRDYIISSPNPANDMCRIRLSDQSATTPATVRYQYGRRGQIETDLTVRLKQGTTVIQEWFHADIREGLYTASQLLDAAAFALITDASDLSLEFEATEPWWL
jgi:hypothetical protein